MQQLNNKRLLVILGPTASGKSDLAIQLAKLFKGEIISADSRQVYRGMDIGTSKVAKDKNTQLSTPNTQYYSQGIRHYLLDVAGPREYFSVAQYQKLVLQVIKDIQQRGKLPILCGGTGLYLSAIIEGWQIPLSPPNTKLRKKLEQLNTEQLFQKLRTLAPKRATTVDRNNKRRIIRALEILAQNKTITPLKKIPPKWNILILGIKRDKNELKELIQKSLLKGLKEGMVEEIKKLKENGVSSRRLEDFGLEYRWVNRFLEKKITYEAMIDSLFRNICHYAKRQMTWFKKMKNIHWIQTPEEAIYPTKQWLNN